jgi:hypothetical protein
MLIKGMTAQEIRVLQEYRRIKADTMPISAIQNIKHPTGGGEAPALSLVEKGYLTADDGRENFALTEKGKLFLAVDAKPQFEEAGGDDEE